MADKRCENGHFIDESWDLCPYCPAEGAEPDIPVVLEGDKDVILGEAVKILSIAQRAGATQIAIAAERSS